MVGSYVQLLSEQYGGKLDENADKYIQYAVDGAQRMQSLIHDLLVFSRVGTKGKELAPTDSGEIVRHVLEDLVIAIRESGGAVTFDPLPTVMADAAQISQLFQNLLANALKFYKPEQVPYVHISAEARDDEWEFCIEDNGIGIDPKYFDRIFTIFQRLHTRSEYPGTGIGLSICKKIVERHGGRIWVESSPGIGTKFLFTLPGIIGAGNAI